MGFLLAEDEAGGLVTAPVGSAKSTPVCRASRLGVPWNGLGIGFLGIPESAGLKTRGAQPLSPRAEHGSPLLNQASLQITSVSC